MHDRLPPPVLPAMRITADNGERTAAWCPWCEQVHWHGAVSGRENRAPHCVADRSSPLNRTGYDLEVVGEAVSALAVTPDKPLSPDARLHDVLDDKGGFIRDAVFRSLTGHALPHHGSVMWSGPHARLQMFDRESWCIDLQGQPCARGDGMITLASALFGIPSGIAAVRLLEAANGARLDEEAAFGIQAIIDAWKARGAQQRPERS